MKKIMYVFLTIAWMLYPNANFATIGHHSLIETKVVVINREQKSKNRLDQWDVLSAIIALFLLSFALGSIFALIIGLINANGLLIILGGIGVLLILYAWYRLATRC